MEAPLNRKLSQYCAVCGHPVEDDAFSYLLTTNPATNRLTILRWNRNLSRSERARAACEPEHVLEMVAHWMGSGTLNLTYAQGVTCRIRRNPDSALAVHPASACAQPVPISELTVNRESLRRVLEINPQALASTLDSLLEALQRDKSSGLAALPALNKTELRITELRITELRINVP
jgi:hypothetical protein